MGPSSHMHSEVPSILDRAVESRSSLHVHAEISNKSYEFQQGAANSPYLTYLTPSPEFSVLPAHHILYLPHITKILPISAFHIVPLL